MKKNFEATFDNEEHLRMIVRHLEALEEGYDFDPQDNLPDWSPSYSPGPSPTTPELLPRPPSPWLGGELQSLPSLIALPMSPIPAPPALMTYEEWLACFDESDSGHSSTLVEPPTSPQLQSSPLHQSSLHPPPASPDKILFYDPADEMYYEVSPQHIYSDRVNVGEVEVLDAVDVVLDSSDYVILDSPDVVTLDSPEMPCRSHLDGVRRHLF